jgi:hypothetical protein
MGALRTARKMSLAVLDMSMGSVVNLLLLFSVFYRNLPIVPYSIDLDERASLRLEAGYDLDVIQPVRFRLWPLCWTIKSDLYYAQKFSKISVFSDRFLLFHFHWRASQASKLSQQIILGAGANVFANNQVILRSSALWRGSKVPRQGVKIN